MGLSRGRLNRRVTLMRKGRTPKERGGFDTTWTPIATVWAEVIGINGREAVIAQALQGVSYYRVTIGWRADLTDADQITFGALNLNVRSISDPDGQREALLILADTASAQAAA